MDDSTTPQKRFNLFIMRAPIIIMMPLDTLLPENLAGFVEHIGTASAPTDRVDEAHKVTQDFMTIQAELMETVEKAGFQF